MKLNPAFDVHFIFVEPQEKTAEQEDTKRTTNKDTEQHHAEQQQVPAQQAFRRLSVMLLFEGACPQG